ncbi:hypothetical protein SAMN05421770_104368 [Granulicella rosea]|uniref:Peptidase M1 membrane alanine aminopeptidase domain-containing protein n=1 Tax=Granulicella rosea TaxID=474952 RepID=A0A239KBA7_9BACT|nr:hypothetical protein [Granulicella rosea]SNT14404.1 hypothetical protein SAMN05421770_104368 [Granulicella rosea]
MSLRTFAPVFSCLLLLASNLVAQETTQQPGSQPATNLPAGKVIFSRSTDPDADPAAAPQPVPLVKALAAGDEAPGTPVTDAERATVSVSGYDLDLHLTPAAARIEAHATLTLRNTGSTPLSRIPLQLSSTLRWQSFALRTASGAEKLNFTQSPIATDADHTGYAQEAVLTLPAPLAPGASLTVTTFYAGEIRQSGARLEMIGAAPAVAAQSDWDQISAAETEAPTALRGFGNVLWYPCARPAALLGDGNRLFALLGQTRLEGASATIRLRLTLEYVGEPPANAIFDGVLSPFDHTANTDDQVISQTHGIATVSFATRTIGFRIPDLFVVDKLPETGDNQLVSAMTDRPDAAMPYQEAAVQAEPLVADWLGPTPISPLLLLDHAGQTFEDEALLVTPLHAKATPEELAPILVHGLTHASLRSVHPWIEEGVAEFMNLVATEQAHGRAAAISQLQQQSNVIALAEPDLNAGSDAGQPLIAASSEIFFRAKAAAVWWQLRGILGDDLLKQGLQAYRRSEALNPAFDREPAAMQRTLEKVSQRDLAWFFDDWVNRDRSLPDLTIIGVTPHPLPAIAGKNPGYLVAVEVRNDGDASAEIPVTVRSGELSATERLRIPARSSASTRIPFQGTPESVQVNDGGMPELRATAHTREIKLQLK